MGSGYIPSKIIYITLSAIMERISDLDGLRVRRIIVYAPAAAAMQIAFGEDGEEYLQIEAGGRWDTDFMPETTILDKIYVRGSGTCKLEIWRAK